MRMQTIMSVSLAPETLQAFDSWRAQRGLARGKAIQELLNLAAAWERSGALAGDGAIDDGPALARRLVGRGVDGLFEGLNGRPGGGRTELLRNGELVEVARGRRVDPFEDER